MVAEPLITTLDELLASHAVITAKEVGDKAACSDLLNPSRETLRAPLFQWAALGFPAIYVIKTVDVTPPSICCDGVVRPYWEYYEHILGKSIADVCSAIQALLEGIQVSYSFDGNRLRIHVSRL
jgi:hypothetical protein